MDYNDGKAIVLKLQEGLKAGVPATFEDRDKAGLLNLIETEMIDPHGVRMEQKAGTSSQNLKALQPVTNKGKQLFSL